MIIIYYCLLQFFLPDQTHFNHPLFSACVAGLGNCEVDGRSVGRRGDAGPATGRSGGLRWAWRSSMTWGPGVRIHSGMKTI